MENKLHVRQLFDEETWTYTYLIYDMETREAALLDSVDIHAERDIKQIQELGLMLKYLIETHVHADHITGISNIKKHYPVVTAMVAEAAGNECADQLLKDGDTLSLGDHTITVISTPGHTNGCISYYTEGYVFTGDALLIRGCGRTDFQQGDAGKLYDSITKKLFTLPDSTIVYPAHNYAGLTQSTIKEEKYFNPRLSGKSKEQFVEIMNNLNLPMPKKIMESVPANLQCGRLKDMS